LSEYLLDTNIVSAFAPKKGGFRPPQETIDWLSQNEQGLYLSAVSVIEIESGLVKLGRVGRGRWQKELTNWHEVLLIQFINRILPLDVPVARAAALITDRTAARGLNPGFPDIVIAATAVIYGMTLLTRNLRHFEASGAVAIDPFDQLAGSDQP